MKYGKFINKDNKTKEPKHDAWILAQRDSILDWFRAEHLKPEYETASDEEMLKAVADHIQQMCYAEPAWWWDNVISEVAECLLELDEWDMCHYDIEDWLFEHITWRPEDCTQAATN
jgi:hypothetical protein